MMMGKGAMISGTKVPNLEEETDYVDLPIENGSKCCTITLAVI